MKKSLIKLAVFLTTFVLALFVGSRFMNKDHDNLTVEMSKASLPLLTMKLDGMEYNQLHGYVTPMQVAYQRECVTALDENRSAEYVIELFGQKLKKGNIEVRNLDGTRLIENIEMTGYQEDDKKVTGSFGVKDLIEKEEEYSLTFILTLEDGRQVYYYTRAIWSDTVHAVEKMKYVVDFHEKLYDKDAAKSLTKYLETNAKLESNLSFHKVNIHSSFKQITWGDLNVKELGEPIVRLKEIAGQTASFLIDYVVAIDDGTRNYYTMQEYFRIKYSPERMYLLDYERTMTQLVNTAHLFANDKILLGITSEDVQMMESEKGNIVAFEEGKKLFSYDGNTNRLVQVFGYYGKEDADWRTIYNQHDLKVLSVSENGDIVFAVYGYFNRGRHEGEAGLLIYRYTSNLNTVEELVYVPTTNSAAIMRAELDQLLYLNKEEKLFFKMDNAMYEVNLVSRTYRSLVSFVGDNSYQISDDFNIVIWTEEKEENADKLYIRNLDNEFFNVVETKEDEILMALGFMQEDIIYGVAKREDIVKEDSGNLFVPMYKICICDSKGATLKEYSLENIYVTGVEVDDNQIVLSRLEKNEKGKFKEISQDHIMNNSEAVNGKNYVVTADIDVYERYIQIKVPKTIDTKAVKLLTPKEVIYEGGRVMDVAISHENDRFYVYGPYGIDGIYESPANAVNLAYDEAAVVVNETGSCIWMRGNRVTKNQIMAIKEAKVTEEKNSLAVCLDTILGFEGIVRNSEYLLAQGQTMFEILEDNLEQMQILDLTGCNLDSILFYLNRDIPVLTLLQNDEAVLLTGFNEYNVVIMDPVKGTLYKKGINDSTEWLRENGNCFITYWK